MINGQTAYERLIDRLRQDGRAVRPDRPNHAMASCPGPNHKNGDRHPSLSITAIEGQILLHCHVPPGCTNEEIADALGCSLGELVYDSPKGADYPYDNGRVVHRTPDKQFFQSGSKNSQPTLYRRAKVIEAVKNGETILLVEGEKDVHALESIGVVATTAPMGAANFDKVDASPLYGAEIIAIVDNDDGAGEEWAQQVLAKLGGEAKSLDFAKAKVGKDISDHIAAGHTLAEIVPWYPPEPDDPEPFLKLRSIRELRAYVTSQGPRKWLARGIWPAIAYGVVGGEPKAQKTWNAEDLAVSVASGTCWLGHFEIDHPGPVVIFCGEGGEGAILRRLDAIAEFKGVDLDDLPITVCARVPHLSNLEQMAELKRAIEQHQPVLVILDPLYLAARGANLRDLYDMGGVLETPQHLCTDRGAALAVVHHYNRSREAKGAGRFSGAGPAEWGRVLVGTDVVSRYTDKTTKETKVVTELEIIGGEVHDQKYRLTRKVRAEDPDDLDSPLHYHVAVTQAEAESTKIDKSGGMKPSAQRVYAVLTTDPAAAWSVRDIGDRLADQGRPLKARTIQDALISLGDLVSGLVIDKRGTTLWTVEEARDD